MISCNGWLIVTRYNYIITPIFENCKTFVMHIYYKLRNTIYTNVLRSDFMKEFKIPKIPATTSKTIRFPNDVIEEVEKRLKKN